MSPFGNAGPHTQKRKNVFEDTADSKRWDSKPTTTTSQKSLSQTSFGAPSKNGATTAFGVQDSSKDGNGITDNLLQKGSGGFGQAQAASPQVVFPGGKQNSPSAYEKDILDQLRKDKLRPPAWPMNPGDPQNLKAMDDHRVKFKAYESKVRASLVKAGLIDDPDVRKKLSDAIDFRGICEDMCPEGEKVSRIVEHDVKLPERTRSNGPDNGWPNPDLMVKSFKRSAAGMDSPLPTEVRSPAALRRTLDYLIDEVLQGDENLPVMHGFLWDRTRAIRKDFIFQNAMTPEERIDQIYCLETITRFHAVALHLLSKDGKEDFSEQQEREQLGKTLLSLMQVYDECKDMDIEIEHEAEFRAYYLLFNAHDPFVMQQMQDWNRDFWFQSPEVQTVITLIDAMRNVWNGRGPMRPSMPLTTGSASFISYFSIVENPQVSYTMACLAEIHFTEIRRHILKTLHKAYGRVRDGPKDLTAKVLNELFRFDTEGECVDFLKDLDMQFSSEGAAEPYLVVERRKSIPSKTIKQSASQAMVERKRGGRSLPKVIHATVIEESSPNADNVHQTNGLFVDQTPQDIPLAYQKSSVMDGSFTDDESPSASPAPRVPGFALPPTTTPGSLFSSPQPPSAPTTGNPFLPQPASASTPSAPGTNQQITASQAPAFSWPSATSLSTTPQKPPPSKSPQGEAPKVSWPAPSNTVFHTPPTTGTSETTNPFGYLFKPSDKPHAALLSGPTVSNSGTTSSIFSSFPSMGDKDLKFDNATSKRKPLAGENNQQSVPSATGTLFPATPPPAVSTIPPLFAPPVSQSTLPIDQPAEMIKSPAPGPSAHLTSQPVAQPTSEQTPTVPLASSTALAPLRPKDPMDSFTKWFLLGDGGLMEKLQDKLVKNLVQEAFNLYHRQEAENKQQEEDEKSWEEALRFRKYSLGVKWFYRWRDITRRNALKRIGQLNRSKWQAYREAKAAEARAERKKKQKEEQARLKRLTAPSSWLEELEKDRNVKRARRESMSLSTSRRTSPVSDADALLATGVFGGMPNQQEIAAECVRDDDSIYDALVGVHLDPDPKRQVMGPPAKPSKDPLRSVRDAGISKAAPKQNWSKKAQALHDLVRGKRKDDDLLSFRSSTSSRLAQSVRSVPASGKATNFSRYQSSSPRSSVGPDRPKNGPSSGIKSSYWLLRSRGLYATPTGHILSDKAPQPRTTSMLENLSQYSGGSENGDHDDGVLEQDGAYRASLGLTGRSSRRSTFSMGAEDSPSRSRILNPKPAPFRQSLPSGGPPASMLLDRQRGDGDAASEAGSNMSMLPQDVEETLRELRKVAAEMDEDTNWYREQRRQMSESQERGA